MQSAPIKANGIPAHINDTALVPLPSLAIEVSCHRNRHVHVVSDICQDAFDDKFSHAKGECAQGKCEKSFFSYFSTILLIPLLIFYNFVVVLMNAIFVLVF